MAVTDNAALRFEDVTRVFLDERGGSITAAEEINLTIPEGEFISLVGPSGCGKSTLLRLAAGLDSPTTGKVWFEGRCIEGPSPQRGLVFQSYNAFPWLTVRENVAFGLQEKGECANGKVKEWLEFMGLSEFADSFPKALSGGMRQRLAIARTMIVEPRLLLLDEPFGALDETRRDSMQQLLLKAVRQTKCTVILVTHDLRESVLLADRVVLLKPRPGRILKVIDSTLAKPRTREQMKTPEFLEIYELLVHSFPA